MLNAEKRKRLSSLEDAVSPVIGVVLMVAVTVILAAIFSTFVFGMVTTVPKTKVIAAIVQQPDANNIIVTYQGGQDAGSCIGIRWAVTDAAGATQAYDMSVPQVSSRLQVGTSYTITGSFSRRDHVVATAYFSDGSEQVILDSTI
jgi:flagellin-like protein